MKLLITKTSNYNYEKVAYINTMEELFEFIDNCGCDEVVVGKFFHNGEYVKGIEIYDDYRE